MAIDLNKLEDLLEVGGERALSEIIAGARQVIASGGKVDLQYEYTNAKPDVVRVLRTVDQLEEWRKEITPLPLRKYVCPICGELLTYMDRDDRSWSRFKCYSGCASIFRLSTDIPNQMKILNPKTGEETAHKAVQK